MKPSAGMCKKIAHALDVTPEEVMRYAGILDPLPADQDQAEEMRLLEYYRKLSYEERLRLVEQARWAYERERETKRRGDE